MTTPRFASLCYMCEYFVPGMDPKNTRDKPVCVAFPEGIPLKILSGGFDHRKQFDDETVLFRKAEGVTDEDVEAWEAEVLEQEKAEMRAMIAHREGGEPAE